MIAASVQCNVDAIPKGSHRVSVMPPGLTNKLVKIDIAFTWKRSVMTGNLANCGR
jgi:hypothetical protein